MREAVLGDGPLVHNGQAWERRVNAVSLWHDTESLDNVLAIETSQPDIILSGTFSFFREDANPLGYLHLRTTPVQTTQFVIEFCDGLRWKQD